jgi:hypothetical protein
MGGQNGTGTPAARDTEFDYHLMDALRGNLSDAEKGISRQLILIAILSAFFILLATNQIGDVVFSSVKIKNDYPVQAYLPIVIAVLYLSTVNTMQMAVQLATTLDSLVRRLRPEASGSYSERLLWPPTGVFTTPSGLPTLLNSGRTATISSRVRYIVYLAGPAGIIIYAIQFLLRHQPGPLQWTAASISVIIALPAVLGSLSLAKSLPELAAGPPPTVRPTT